jgi:branched-chain amino acid transport system ATP-binding protein
VTGPVLQVDDLHLSFAGIRALRAVSFEVAAGELFAIIGPNGAGKTSLFNCPSALLWLGRARREEVRHRRVVEDIVDFLEIERYRKQPVGILPYGIKKRVELGRALAMEPSLLLLDEPVSGMNVEETEDMARFILDIREELAVAMILVEHDMGVVMDLADRVLALDFGIPIALGPPAEIQHHPDVIRAYLGEQYAKAGAATEERVTP